MGPSERASYKSEFGPSRRGDSHAEAGVWDSYAPACGSSGAGPCGSSAEASRWDRSGATLTRIPRWPRAPGAGAGGVEEEGEEEEQDRERGGEHAAAVREPPKVKRWTRRPRRR
ncbi:unnamed protein product [Prorocentrum cordatum]|uniref:Uncharacterized protein n=1 Tax=Prorocentrum cordatum TaxID=2364126 RepID=A0ABN9TH66_9DINO|nr:unnamed protein product [Polarella glacialis]